MTKWLQVPEFIRNDQWPVICLIHGPPCLGCDAEGISQTHSKTQLSQSPNSKKHCKWSETACRRNRSTGQLKASHYDWCAKAGGEHFEHKKWLSSIRQSVHCVVLVTRFCCVSAQTVFVAQKKSPRGQVRGSLLYLKFIKCCSAV